MSYYIYIQDMMALGQKTNTIIYMTLTSVKILNVYCLCFVLLSLIHVYNL